MPMLSRTVASIASDRLHWWRSDCVTLRVTTRFGMKNTGAFEEHNNNPDAYSLTVSETDGSGVGSNAKVPGCRTLHRAHSIRENLIRHH
jgi:hypothetical protein